MPWLNVVTDTRPNYEIATYLGHLALRHAVDYFKDKGYDVDDLVGDKAIREDVLRSLRTRDPIFLFGVGHGNETTFTGQYHDKIFWKCDSSDLSGRVVYLLSCITAAELGPDAVNKGCRCYIGYDKEFVWGQINSSIDPLEDEVGKAFYEPVLELLYKLADGATTGEAFKASIDKWNEWINYWARQPGAVAAEVLIWLVWDRDHQKLIGDPNIRVGIPTMPTVPVVSKQSLIALASFSPLVIITLSMLINESRHIKLW